MKVHASDEQEAYFMITETIIGANSCVMNSLLVPMSPVFMSRQIHSSGSGSHGGNGNNGPRIWRKKPRLKLNISHTSTQWHYPKTNRYRKKKSGVKT